MSTPYRITLTYHHGTQSRRQKRQFRQTYEAAAPKHSEARAAEVAQYITDLHDAIWLPFPKTCVTCTIRLGSITQRFDHLPTASELLQKRL